MLSQEAIAEIHHIAAEYPEPRSALIPALFIAQKENNGYCSPQVMAEVAAVLRLTPAYVRSVASFYTMIYKEPVGRHIVDVCTNLACMLRGAEGNIQYISERIKCPIEGNSPDGRFTLHSVECLGYCDIAPMMQIDEETYGHLTPGTIDQILEEHTTDA
jgi:NADH-quinone oxidoreductase subunit E